jgi:hypothetical protein
MFEFPDANPSGASPRVEVLWCGRSRKKCYVQRLQNSVKEVLTSSLIYMEKLKKIMKNCSRIIRVLAGIFYFPPISNYMLHTCPQLASVYRRETS